MDPRLSKEEEEKLIETLNEFIDWMIHRKIISSSSKVQHTFEMPHANADWVMQVKPEKNSVSFNTFILEQCNIDFFRIVVLHEYFHLVVQKVPNKDDATKIKDEFGDELMKLIDIEADFYTALFLKEKLDYSLIDYLKIKYTGSTVFRDKWVRAIKFERFIGELLSVSKMFMTYPKKEDEVTAFDLYLPTISPIYTEDSLHILVVKKEHILFEEIKASYSDFAKLKNRYLDASKYSLRGYIEHLVTFSVKALDIPLTEELKTEIDNL